MSVKSILAPLILIAAAGCGEPMAPSRLLTFPDVALQAGNAPVHRVTGGGQLVGPGFTETYGIVAQVDPAGVVRGQLQMFLDGLPGVHASITCLAVDGSSAWIGGEVTKSHDENVIPVGTPFWFRVQDNGQGSDPPDRLSSVRLGQAASICNERRPVMVPWVLARGNVVVR
jgi:hypothetical protein